MINQIFNSSKAYLCLLQETKFKYVDSYIVNNVWNYFNLGCAASNDVGLSRGLLITWKDDYVNVISRFKGVYT